MRVLADGSSFPGFLLSTELFAFIAAPIGGNVLILGRNDLLHRKLGSANPAANRWKTGAKAGKAGKNGRLGHPALSETDPPRIGVPRAVPILGPGKALPSRRRKPATRAKYGSPSRKTRDIGAAARLSPPGTLWVRA